MNLPFRTKKLGKYIKRVSAKARDVKLSSGDITVYGVTNKEGIVVTGKDSSDDLSNYIVVGENMFAYNPYRVNVGSLGLSSKGFKGVVSPAYVVFKIKDSLLPDFLFNYLKSDVGINLIKWYGDKGGVRSALRYKDLEKIDIPDLDVKQQEKFLGKLKNINEALAVMYERGTKIREHINLLRQAILQEAVQGKLVEQDPKDEPATELLKKIKAEKERLIKEKKIKKEKPLPPITNDEIPYELPKGWVWCRLGDLLLLSEYGTSEKALGNIEGIPVLGMNHVQNGKVVLDNYKYIYKTSNNLPRLYLKKSDLLFNRTNSYDLVGKTGIFYGEDNQFSFASYLIRLRFLKSISAEYINYYMQSKIFRTTQIERQVIQQCGQANFNGTKLKNTLVPLPCGGEQERIVKHIMRLMQYCDELETKIKQSRSDSEKLMQAVLQEAFEN